MLGAVVLVSETASKNASTETAKFTPINVEITNQTDTSFTVSWQTKDATTGVVRILSPKITDTDFIDDRDVALGADKKTQAKRSTHHITLKHLTPKTKYIWEIYSGNKKFQNTTGPWVATTGPTLATNTSGFEPAFGTVAQTSGAPAADALVYVVLDGSQPLSTYVNPTGSWLVPLSTIRSVGNKEYLPYADRINQSIRVAYGDEEASAVTDISADSPVPVIVLGKSYDFRKNTTSTPQIAQVQPQVLSAQTPASPTVTPVPTVPITPTSMPTLLESPSPTAPPTPTMKKSNYIVSLALPKNGAFLTSTLPLFQGTGIPGENVLVTIGSPNPMQSKMQIGTDGIFRYTPDKPLAAGKQHVTITTLSTNNKPVTLTSTFTILKSGTQVLGDATQSATLTTTTTPTGTPEPQISLSQEVNSTDSASAVSTPTPSPKPPVSGTTEITILGVVFAVGLLAAGAFLFLR